MPLCRRVLVLVVGISLSPLVPYAAGQTGTAPAGKDTVRIRELDSLVVVGRADDLIGVARSASEGRVGAVDLRARPLAREGELLESVPGMIVTQHSGEGKANQYFVRGFNLDHGTDFQTRVEGMPVNMPSHAHGQGYTDLNFLIPELVDHLDYRLGVYHADVGDFGSAGAAEFHLARRVRPFAVASAGGNGLARLVAGGTARVGEGDLLVGGEAKGYDGPWTRAEGLRKYSGMVRYSWAGGNSRFSVLGLAYRNRWNATDQIPLRAVEQGTLSRLGQIDSTDGGNTQRYSLSGSWRHSGTAAVQEVQLYGIYSDLDLFSNFGFFLDDPVRGDQFRQHEGRIVLGLNAQQVQPVQALGGTHVLKVGVQTRADLINGLRLDQTQARQSYATVRADDVRQWGTGLFVEGETRWTRWFRTTTGLRGDLYTFAVTSNLAANSGHRTAALLSPSASMVFAPARGTELYVSGGFGFHSNDARGTTIRVDPASGDPASSVDPLVRSRGAEVGVRISPLTGWRSTAAVWLLHLDSELLFIGDGGTTEASAASQRAGITLANFYRPRPELAFDVDLSLSRARLSGISEEANHIPGALEHVLAAGVTWLSTGSGPFGSLRVRHFGGYPLEETNRVRASATTLVSLQAGYRLVSGVRLEASVLNLLDTRAYDIQYYYASRLPGEPDGGVEGRHVHPVEPRQVRLALAWGL